MKRENGEVLGRGFRAIFVRVAALAAVLPEARKLLAFARYYGPCCRLPLRGSCHWSGGDLLSHVLRRSTIGAAGLNGRVRDGIGCFPRAIATRPVKRPAGA